MGEGEASARRHVQIPTAVLAAVRLRHRHSERDPGVGVPVGEPESTAIAGTTQWWGAWSNKVVTVAWDWTVVGGMVVMLSQNHIRTNIELVAADRRPEPADLAQVHLYHWIESLAWQRVVIDGVLRRS
jgi:hypothetical protein